MRILKCRSNHLEGKAKQNRNRVIYLVLFGIWGLAHFFSSSNIVFIFPFIIMLVFARVFLKNYFNYRSGIEAENLVIQHLSNLDDNYLLINDIKLPNSYGNIDHIVLGPKGIFVLETKNYNGLITCNGDDWRVYYGIWGIIGYDLKSPSKQVKRNALKIKQIIDRESQKIFKKPLKIWVEGIVVFTNPNVELHLSNTTVPVLRVDELCSYIKNKKSKVRFSSEEVELMGNVILKCVES